MRCVIAAYAVDEECYCQMLGVFLTGGHGVEITLLFDNRGVRGSFLGDD